MSQKWNLQDIKPSDAAPRRNSVPKVRMESTPPHREPETDSTEERSTPRYSAPTRRSGGGKRNVLIITIVTIIVALGLLVGLVFGGATLTVHPKFKDVTVQGTFTAKTAPSARELGYEILTLEADAERQVTATGKEQVEELAQGTITIYNNHSTSPVRLVKNTRFQSGDGKIFRISESVVVPGYTEDGGKKPGTVTANVFADQAGEDYNVQPGRFTVPGFEGEPEFDNVYGESTTAFTGGFVGEKYIVDDAELASTQASLQEELKTTLRGRLQSERPAGFVVYDNAVTFAFTSLPATQSEDGKAVIKERGTLIAPIFSSTQFAEELARKTVSGYEDEPMSITDPYTLTFGYVATGSTTPEEALKTQNEISFELRGNAELVYTFDQEKLIKDLAGKSKTALPAVLGGYPAIERAEATIKPFWKGSFPEKVEDIKLETIIGENE